MSYIIWKGINSNTFSGLIISKLPLISKPKMRTNKIQIDGVDGDIITELGYESYTKELSIGLSYDYNLDEIIKYFTGEGILVLSNEPDKYYKAKIIDCVDYTELLRYKTSTIKFLCQPFKYRLNEEVIDLSIEDKEQIVVNNIGLEKSKPKITLFGTGTIGFTLNGEQIFNYNFPENDSEVVIDSEKQDAYLNGLLKNRNMLGEFPIFECGENVITWNGDLTRIKIEVNSRWL